jgi:N-acetyldiaminopimelate deacetylase
MYYQVYNTESITRDFMEYIQEKTDVEVIECKEAMTGEDFGYMLKEIPGLMFWLGVDASYGLHHAKLDPQEDAIGVAVKVMTSYITHQGNGQSDK